MTERWQAPGYCHIVRASADEDGRLTVLFADATWVEFDGRALLPTEAGTPRWRDLSVDEFGDFIEVPTESGSVDLPADRMRALTDPAFGQHRLELALAEANRIGHRLRLLRERRGLSADEVATRAGLAPDVINRVERGQHDVILTLLDKILSVMGASFDELEEPDSVSQSERIATSAAVTQAAPR
ncbi:MAG: helix-turn-helix domain-containing protein [Dehalococcoidia bacterium]